MSGQETAREFTSQMAVRRGRWRLYVALLGTTERWPEHSFNRALPVPTFTERADALSALGFELLPGAEWTWTEDSETHGDPSSAVLLIAETRVRSRAGVGA
ncbi:DUF6303 family protein [Streptomyces griseoaurantiacus]|uniref:Uncharacterized protein n=1 Tax=Streptomyces griseoaurantiacus TaxID=68213 RepID=A0A1G7K102_9ACTN|nr:DUF6303 family protein [Streptomyces jietaisiensis]SDF30765.1 hypothetical protein SAMN05216260_107136 [Streptomyces jietaisiensis]